MEERHQNPIKTVVPKDKASSKRKKEKAVFEAWWLDTGLMYTRAGIPKNILKEIFIAGLECGLKQGAEK